MTAVAVLGRGWLFHHADDVDMYGLDIHSSRHGKPTVHGRIPCVDACGKNPFDHWIQKDRGLDGGYFSALTCTAAFIQAIMLFAQPLFWIAGRKQHKVQRNSRHRRTN